MEENMRTEQEDFDRTMSDAMAKTTTEEYDNKNNKIESARVVQKVLSEYIKRHYPLMKRHLAKKGIREMTFDYLDNNNCPYKMETADDVVWRLQAFPTLKLFGMQKPFVDENLSLKGTLVDFFLLDDTGAKEQKEMQFVQLTGEGAGTIIPREEMVLEKLPTSNFYNLQFSAKYKDYQTIFTERPPEELGVTPYYARTSFCGKYYYNMDRCGGSPEFRLIAELDNEVTRTMKYSFKTNKTTNKQNQIDENENDLNM